MTGILSSVNRLIFIVCLVISLPIQAAPLVYAYYAKTINVDPDIFFSMALYESGRTVKGVYGPWPWTLNIRNKPFYYDSRLEAYQDLMAELNNGNVDVAIGPMQVYWRYNSSYFDSPWDALNPYLNIKAGASVLAYFYSVKGSLWAAVGAYHSPNSQEIADSYIKQVKIKHKYVLERKL